MGQNDYFAKTLDKGLRVLNLFDENKPAWSLTEISTRMKLNMTSVYRLVNTFVELGYLKKVPKSKLLQLGPMSVALGRQLLQGFDTNRLIESLVEEVHDRYNISIDVSLFHNGYLIQVYKSEAANTLTYRQDRISEHLYCTSSGKAVLASLTDEQQRELVANQSYDRRTKKTLTDADSLQQDLVQTAQRGYALNDEEYMKGLIAIAAPILSPADGQPLGALCFNTTTLDHDPVEFEEKYAPVLCDLARRLSEVME